MKKLNWLIILVVGVLPQYAISQSKGGVSTENWMSSPGIIGTFVLIAIVMVVAAIILLVKLNSYIDTLKRRQVDKNKMAFDDEIIAMNKSEIDTILEKRKAALTYKLSGDELGGENEAVY